MVSVRFLFLALPALAFMLCSLMYVGEATRSPQEEYMRRLLDHDIRQHFSNFENFPNTLEPLYVNDRNQADLIWRRNHLLARADDAVALASRARDLLVEDWDEDLTYARLRLRAYGGRRPVAPVTNIPQGDGTFRAVDEVAYSRSQAVAALERILSTALERLR